LSPKSNVLLFFQQIPVFVKPTSKKEKMSIAPPKLHLDFGVINEYLKPVGTEQYDDVLAFYVGAETFIVDPECKSCGGGSIVC
jgi:hypothetical protein